MRAERQRYIEILQDDAPVPNHNGTYPTEQSLTNEDRYSEDEMISHSKTAIVCFGIRIIRIKG